MSNAHHCHRCDQLVRPGYTCAIGGRTISEHAAAHDCPLGKFDASHVPPNPDPYAKHHAAMAVKSFDGSALWRELHTRAANAGDLSGEEAWLLSWLRRVPCGECQRHSVAWLKDNPVDFSSPEAYFAWSIKFHNAVNRKLGRREWTAEEARRIYG
jgi:hypothetical protein